MGHTRARLLPVLSLPDTPLRVPKHVLSKQSGRQLQSCQMVPEPITTQGGTKFLSQK